MDTFQRVLMFVGKQFAIYKLQLQFDSLNFSSRSHFKFAALAVVKLYFPLFGLQMVCFDRKLA